MDYQTQKLKLLYVEDADDVREATILFFDIVRHPYLPKSFFENLWKTIKKEKKSGKVL